MFSTRFDPEADAFYVRFAPKGMVIEDTQEVAPGVNVDLDANGDVIGIEVLNVSIKMAARPAAARPVAAE